MIIKRIADAWKEATNEITEEREANEFDSTSWEKTRKQERILMEGLVRYANSEEKEILEAAFSSFEKAFFGIAKWEEEKGKDQEESLSREQG